MANANGGIADDGVLGDPLSVRELLKALIDKDCLITDLPQRQKGPPAVGSNAIPTFQVMPDLSKGISNFEGEGDPAKAKDWIENLKSTAALHRWPEELQFETAKSHMVGAARDWLRTRRSEIKSWTDFEERFRRTFLSHMRAAERWRRMQERTQQRHETTVAYFHAKSRLCAEANLDFCDMREQIVIGLCSRQLCTMLTGRSHDDLEDLLHDIMEFERVETERQKNYGGRTEPKASSPARSGKMNERRGQAERSPQNTIRDSRLPLRNERGEPKCYNCSKFGHLA